MIVDILCLAVTALAVFWIARVTSDALGIIERQVARARRESS